MFVYIRIHTLCVGDELKTNYWFSAYPPSLSLKISCPRMSRVSSVILTNFPWPVSCQAGEHSGGQFKPVKIVDELPEPGRFPKAECSSLSVTRNWCHKKLADYPFPIRKIKALGSWTLEVGHSVYVAFLFLFLNCLNLFGMGMNSMMSKAIVLVKANASTAHVWSDKWLAQAISILAHLPLQYLAPSIAGRLRQANLVHHHSHHLAHLQCRYWAYQKDPWSPGQMHPFHYETMIILQ